MKKAKENFDSNEFAGELLKIAKELGAVSVAKELTKSRQASSTESMVKGLAEGFNTFDRILDAASDKSDKASKQAYIFEQKLKREVRTAEDAQAVIDALSKNKVDTGRLGGDFVDVLETLSGQKIYPAPWRSNKQRKYITDY